jgi:hypothetical protein
MQMQNFRQPGLFLASIILATCEALFWNMTDAMIHVKAAFSFRQHVTSKRGVIAKHEDSWSTNQTAELAELDELARWVDLHIASYRLGQAPELPTASIQNLDGLLQSSTLCGTEATLTLLNACYEFTSRASPYKYYDPVTGPSYHTLLEEQCNLVALVRKNLSCLSSGPGTTNKTEHEDGRRRSLLVVQCLSALIYLSTILAPFEVAYDSFTESFAEIVQRSSLITKAEIDRHIGSFTGCPRVRFQPGLFQPLYLTAMKCRHPRIRRRAMNLFAAVGLEGPWDCGVMAAIARQAIRHEEDGGSSFVPEARRLHGCGVYVLETDSFGSPQTVEVEFSLCKDVEALIATMPEDQSSYWTIWREKVIVATTDQAITERVRFQG